MSKTQQEYVSYLLRLRKVNLDGRTIWRASLQDTRTGQVQVFENLQAAFVFLHSQFVDGVPDESVENHTDDESK